MEFRCGEANFKYNINAQVSWRFNIYELASIHFANEQQSHAQLLFIILVIIIIPRNK